MIVRVTLDWLVTADNAHYDMLLQLIRDQRSVQRCDAFHGNVEHRSEIAHA